tara:strand:+ start:29896 stop:30039 length:144 start_codon:yes stop_codon:yes gene_type:complete
MCDAKGAVMGTVERATACGRAVVVSFKNKAHLKKLAKCLFFKGKKFA